VGGSTAGVMGDVMLLLIERCESRVRVLLRASQRSAPHTKDAFWRAWPHKRLGPSPITICPKPWAEHLIFEYLISSSESYGAAMGLFEPAVAHGLAPSAAAASSDALIPKPLAASSGTASACSYESTRV